MGDVRADTVSDLAGTGPVDLTGQSAAKAWVNFVGTGTIAINDSFNVSSLTDEGTGDYLTNLTNSMSSSDYSGYGAGATSGNVGFDDGGGNTASALSLGGFGGAATRADLSTVSGGCFGDRA